MKTTTFDDLKSKAAESLPPLHAPVAFAFHGKYLQGQSTLKTYNIKRGDTIFMDVRREAFNLTKTGPPIFGNEQLDDNPDEDAKE